MQISGAPIRYLYTFPSHQQRHTYSIWLQPTNATETFLQRVTENFKIPFIKKFKMQASKMLRAITEFEYCETYRTQTPPLFFEVNKTSDYSCKSWCRRTNSEYVLFVNQNIAKVKCSLFEDESFILTLNESTSNTGGCVFIEQIEKFRCLCKASYEIMVNRKFYLTFRHTVNRTLNQDQNTNYREQFSALAILLKFYLKSAAFYIVYLLYNHNRPLFPKRTQFVPDGLFDDEIILENVNGMVQDRGIFKDYNDDLFKKLYESISYRSCDISDVADQYYNVNKDIKEAIWKSSVIIAYQYFVNELKKNDRT